MDFLSKEYSTISIEDNGNKTIDYEQLILSIIAKQQVISNTWDLSIELKIDHQVLIGVIKSLLTDSYLCEEPLSTTYWILTSEGEQVLAKGSPEMQVLNMITNDTGISLSELQQVLGADVVKIGLGVCMKNKWIQKNGDMIVRLVTSGDKSLLDDTSLLLTKVASNDTISLEAYEKDLQNLKKRKLVQQVTRKSLKITKGPEFREIRVRKMADLSKTMLGNKSEVSK